MKRLLLCATALLALASVSRADLFLEGVGPGTPQGGSVQKDYPRQTELMFCTLTPDGKNITIAFEKSSDRNSAAWLSLAANARIPGKLILHFVMLRGAERPFEYQRVELEDVSFLKATQLAASGGGRTTESIQLRAGKWKVTSYEQDARGVTVPREGAAGFIK
ncbi:MAG: hypothetical protein QM758_00885 [Armatimonas sp.]